MDGQIDITAPKVIPGIDRLVAAVHERSPLHQSYIHGDQHWRAVAEVGLRLLPDNRRRGADGRLPLRALPRRAARQRGRGPRATASAEPSWRRSCTGATSGCRPSSSGCCSKRARATPTHASPTNRRSASASTPTGSTFGASARRRTRSSSQPMPRSTTRSNIGQSPARPRARLGQSCSRRLRPRPATAWVRAGHLWDGAQQASPPVPLEEQAMEVSPCVHACRSGASAKRSTFSRWTRRQNRLLVGVLTSNTSVRGPRLFACLPRAAQPARTSSPGMPQLSATTTATS